MYNNNIMNFKRSSLPNFQVANIEIDTDIFGQTSWEGIEKKFQQYSTQYSGKISIDLNQLQKSGANSNSPKFKESSNLNFDRVNEDRPRNFVESRGQLRQEILKTFKRSNSRAPTGHWNYFDDGTER